VITGADITTKLWCTREYAGVSPEAMINEKYVLPASAHGTNPASAAMAGMKISY
jgi:glycine cleavage system protein P-like pyridoxal-binding family